MSELQYPALFEPFQIGNIEIRNRIVMAPMDPKHDPEGHPMSDRTIAYLAARARGGTGLIVTGCLCAEYNIEGGLAVPSEFRFKDELKKQIPKLVEAVHAYGSKVFVQLWLNFGRICFPISVKHRIAPSETQNLWAPELKNRALTTREVEKIIQSNVDAVKFCADLGVDGCVIVGPYGGYLADQFGTALFNHRTDRFGGSVRNRAEATIEMIRGIKGECGNDFPVVVRMGTRHHIEGVHKGQIPGQPYKEAGRDVPESIQLAKYYVTAGADAFLVANGCYDALYWQYSPCYLPEGEWLDEVEPLTKAVKVPVICSGRLLVPEIAEKAIEDGQITAAALGRSLLADPEWGNKAYEGRAEEIRPCIGCNNGCIGRVMNAEPLMCAVNANIYHESEQEIIPAAMPKKIAVIGAGIAGMEAARVAKLRGHDVEIYEKTDETGGLFVAAAKPEFKHGDERLLAWYDRQMKNLNIPIHFNRKMSADAVKDLQADEVIVASGSSPKTLPIPGLADANTIFATELLRGEKEGGKNVIVMGGGLIGCEAALKLSEDPDVHVTIVELARYLMLGGAAQPPLVNLEYMERILGAKENVTLMMRSGVTEIKGNTAIVNTTGKGTSEVLFDQIVLAIGLKSEQGLYAELQSELKDHVHMIGDASSVGTVLTAVHAADELAKQL